MKIVWAVAGTAWVAIASTQAAAVGLLIDSFDYTLAPSRTIPVARLGIDKVTLDDPDRDFVEIAPGVFEPVIAYFDIASVTPAGEPAPLGGWRGINVTQGTGVTQLAVLRRADIAGFDPLQFPGTLGFSTGVFEQTGNAPPFRGQIVWDGGPSATGSGAVGLDLDASRFGLIELETFVVDDPGATVEVTIRITDDDGNVSTQTQSGFTSRSRFSYDFNEFVADIESPDLADLRRLFSIEIEFATDSVAADLTIDVASLQLIPEPVTLAGFGLGLALTGLAIRRRR